MFLSAQHESPGEDVASSTVSEGSASDEVVFADSVSPEPNEPLEPPHDRAQRATTIALWVMFAAALFVIIAAIPVGILTARPLECARCHNDTAFLQVTGDSAHADASCVSCHAGADPLARVDFGFRQAYGMMIPLAKGAMRDPGVAYTDRCTACHVEGIGGIVKRDGITIDHSKCTVGRSCIDCHGGLAHGDTTGVWINAYTMDLCLDCHSTADARRDCTTCHEGQRAGDRPVYKAFAVTHGPDWERTHGMGDQQTCTACHEPDKCAKCHGAGVPHIAGFYELHGDAAKDATANCSTCHATSFCTDCHGSYDMPHPDTFIETHSTTAKSLDDPSCLPCHKVEDCQQCHAAHIHPGGSIDLRGVE